MNLLFVNLMIWLKFLLIGLTDYFTIRIIFIQLFPAD